MKKSSQKVAPPNLGSKRVCTKCGTKFYDFGKVDDVECPKCRASIDPSSVAPVIPEPVKKPKKEMPEEVLMDDETPPVGAEAEFESLEELEEDEENLVDDLDVTEGEGDF